MAGSLDHSEYRVFKFREVFTGDDDTTAATEVVGSVYLNTFARPTQLLIRYLVISEPDGTVALAPRANILWGYGMVPIGDAPPVPA